MSGEDGAKRTSDGRQHIDADGIFACCCCAADGLDTAAGLACATAAGLATCATGVGFGTFTFFNVLLCARWCFMASLAAFLADFVGFIGNSPKYAASHASTYVSGSSSLAHVWNNSSMKKCPSPESKW